MGPAERSAAGAAAILNAAWQVRHYCRPGQEKSRAAALERMAAITLQQLAAGRESEPILYAVAVGLYRREDPRFAV